LRGKIAAAGVDLPQCSRVADALIAFKPPKEAPINEALDEVEQAIRNLADDVASA
jgi:hypothetical protein